nr:MAG TPA: hypothetical protein [Caudoviricetes sp.]
MQYPKRVRYTVYPVRLGRVSARRSLFLVSRWVLFPQGDNVQCVIQKILDYLFRCSCLFDLDI